MSDWADEKARELNLDLALEFYDPAPMEAKIAAALRAAKSEGAADERKAIVAWLRTRDLRNADLMHAAAYCIENGDHLSPPPAQPQPPPACRSCNCLFVGGIPATTNGRCRWEFCPSNITIAQPQPTQPETCIACRGVGVSSISGSACPVCCGPVAQPQPTTKAETCGACDGSGMRDTRQDAFCIDCNGTGRKR